ncbi:MAG: YIP1 family protein [Oscillospiraceae bacterium]|nr:YIP1 family protein [Oscillospiraceae bacterium]
MILMIVLGSFTTSCDSLFPLFNRYAIDNYVGRQTLDGLTVFILLYLALLILQTLATYISTKRCGKIEVSVNRDLRNNAFTHLQSLSLSYFNRNSIGSVHSRVMSDTSKIGETVAWRLMDIVWSSAYLVSVLVNMALISPPLFAVIAVMIVLAGIMTALFQRKLIAVNRLIRKQNSVLTGHMNEMITGIRAIKSMAVEEKTEKRYLDETEKMRSLSVRSGHISAMFGAAISTVGSLVLAVVLWQGGRLTLQGAMQIGTLSVFMSYAVGMLWPIQSLVTTLTQLATIRVNWERINIFMQVMGILMPFLIWVLSNWALTTLFDGKGNLKNVYIASCYAIAPYPIVMIPNTFLSNILAADESTFYVFFYYLSLAWCVILMVVGMSQIHEYKMGKNLLCILFSIVGMAVIIFILLLFFSLISDGIAYFYSLYKEIIFRLY